MIPLLLMSAQAADRPGPDPLTTLAVGSASYLTLALTHEVGGHGLACAGAGGRPLGFSSVFMVCDTAGLGPGDIRTGTLMGSGANLMVGSTAASWLLFNRPKDAWSQHYLWTTASSQLFLAGSYLTFGGFTGGGLRPLPRVGRPQPMRRNANRPCNRRTGYHRADLPVEHGPDGAHAWG